VDKKGKSATGGNREGAGEINSHIKRTVSVHPLQAPTVLFDRLRSTYSAMAQRHNRADIEYDYRRMAFLYARYAWMQGAFT
jgi:hypothetical protein